MTKVILGYTLIHETEKAWGMWDRTSTKRGGGKQLEWFPKSKYDHWIYHRFKIGSGYNRSVLIEKPRQGG